METPGTDQLEDVILAKITQGFSPEGDFEPEEEEVMLDNEIPMETPEDTPILESTIKRWAKLAGILKS